MATKRQRGDAWEFVVKRKALLPRPLYLTFSSEKEGDEYVAKLEGLLKLGIVPEELRQRQGELITIDDAAREYLVSQHVPDSDKRCLGVVIGRIGATRLRTLDYAWAESWVRTLKHEQQLSPTTIRHHVGALARCFDWGTRHGVASLLANPLRLLPRGYAVYNESDAKAISGSNILVPGDVERDRRMEPQEEIRIRAVLAGIKEPAKQRALKLDRQAALECFFELAVESAMRMRELYTLTVEQIDLEQRTVFLDQTKNGDRRQVPLTSPAVAAIKAYRKLVKQGERGMKGFAFDADRFFPWWNGRGDTVTLRRTTSKLSQVFARVFAAAECADLRFHDLRHEATSRIFERTKLSDIEISRITGHRDPRVLRRYSNLRGSDLARKLW